ncbi:hypothetical protein GIB67_042958 [Kingdonia uniflora]|uniref:R13L1/DRL21-like LRR repeat region domain-containing protein n=1 Tax=Kingdonia uniflora TaxID=39325 RepID=A0A7J7L645_9MAGN|nr:hypothetical protein GIB67_042958 [Kingdonia uniflora]
MWRCKIYDNASKKVFDEIFQIFKYLRVLDLSCIEITELSSSIGNLKFLRYLDLSWTNIEVVPDSVSSLYFLQTLKLEGCENLKELPRELRALRNLKHLHIDCSGTWSKMLKAIGRLNSLRTLQIFKVGEDREGGIVELQRLNLLQGRLAIYNLKNVRDVSEAKEANLVAKKDLHSLELNWNYDEEDDESGKDTVLEGLQPHPNLEKVWITNFRGVKFPNWIVNNFKLPNLVEIYLEECNRCEEVPMFGGLPSLKLLHIHGMKAVRRLGMLSETNDTYSTGKGLAVFPSLKELSISWISNLEEWEDPAVASFPCLEELTITMCPKLRTMPTLFTSLKILQVESSNGTAVSSIVSKLTTLTSLSIKDCSELTFLPRKILRKNNHLQNLEIHNCLNFQTFLEDGEEEMEFVNNDYLTSFSIEYCPILISVPDLQGLSSLRSITISYCKAMQCLSEGFQTLNVIEDLTISNCPKLQITPGLFPSLKKLLIEETNGGVLSSITNKLTSLTSLSIRGISDLIHLPHGLLETNKLLQKFKIWNCPNLQGFLPNVEGMQVHTSLKILKVTDCRNLRSLNLPSFKNLQKLKLGSFSEDLSYYPLWSFNFQENLFYLQRLEIRGWSRLELLPEQAQHLIELRHLIIKDFYSLVDLPEWFGKLVSLERLVIVRCENLKELPEAR